MPTCPRCHKFISEAKWRRHHDYIEMDEKGKKIVRKGRCGKTHSDSGGLHFHMVPR